MDGRPSVPLTRLDLVMTDIVSILTELSNVLGVPAVLFMAFAAFVIRDQGRRIARLEELREKDQERLDSKLDEIYKVVNDSAKEIARMQGSKES